MINAVAFYEYVEKLWWIKLSNKILWNCEKYNETKSILQYFKKT